MDNNDIEIQNYIAENKIDAVKTDTGLYYNIIKAGSTSKPKASDEVTVNYKGKLINGSQFDAGKDISFPLNRVIAGWTEGLQLIGEGGIINLYIPSFLAYGANSPSPDIPANSVLIFEVELTQIIEAIDYVAVNDAEIKEFLTKNNIETKKTESGLYYKVSKVGDGTNPTEASKVTVNYSGKLLDGTVFDANKGISFGLQQVIAGWTEGIQLCEKGGSISLYIPSHLAYGPNGIPNVIPPNTVLMFDVDLIDF